MAGKIEFSAGKTGHSWQVRLDAQQVRLDIHSWQVRLDTHGKGDWMLNR